MRRLPDLGGESLRLFYLVARREFVTRVRSRFFQIGTVVLVVLLAGYIVLQVKVIGKTGTTVEVGFVGATQALAQPLQTATAAEKVTVKVHPVADVATGEAEVRDGTLDALVSGQPNAPDVAVKDSLDPTVAATLDSLVKAVVLNQAVTAQGGDPAAIEAQVAKAGINLVLLDPHAAQRAQSNILGLFVATCFTSRSPCTASSWRRAWSRKRPTASSRSSCRRSVRGSCCWARSWASGSWVSCSSWCSGSWR